MQKKSILKEDLSRLKRICKEYVLPEKKSLIISVALMMVVAGTTTLHAWLVKPALDSVFLKQDATMLVVIPIAILLVTVIKGFATYFQLLLMNLLTMRMAANMRKNLYAHFIRSDISFLHSSSSGNMVASVINEINAITGTVSTLLNGFVKQLLTLVFLVILMFKQSIELSLVAFVGFPLAAYPIYKIGRKLRNLSFSNQTTSQQFTSQMSDTLQYSKLVKAYNCEEFEISRMGKIIEEMYKLGRKISKMSLIASPFVETLGGIGVALVIWYGGHQVLTGKTTPGAFFSFFAAMMMAYRPLKSVSGMNSGVQLGLAASERFYATLEQKPTITDSPQAVDLKNVKGNIKFNNVSFSYIKEKTTLDKINLEVPAGKTIALVGHSGGGKSTIMNMILRFYDPNEGSILLDDYDIRDLTIKSLRRSMAVVNQEVMLFDDTVLENIRYGKENATKEEIIEAAKLAEADDFIKELPNGYETAIGQNGIRLSGGQRQRIAIARAILYNAPILLLDEATSSLDPISEHAIKKALATLMKDRTTIVIAHRLSTVIHADCIYVISEGRVIESGKHQELLDKNGHYAHLYSKQFEIETDK
ncbi:MAG: msbA [Rickettsiaceae bacterium]|jgi:subfamily B ATP-binding cassette protein MsbA|nr:msbA [Rickettsiaceae bacterium]